MASFLSTYYYTWQVFLASWTEDWKVQQKATDQLSRSFHKGIPIVSNLLWNVILFSVMQASLMHMAQFSPEMELLYLTTVLIPCLVGSIAYYCYKYGVEEVARALSLDSLTKWIENWIAMQGITGANLTMTAVFYFAGIWLQPRVLPATWDFSMQFPRDLYEESLRVTIKCFTGLFVICLLLLPLWKRGYEVSMQAAGRMKEKMSLTETLMELIYQTVQGSSLIFMITPLAVVLQDYLGFRVYTIHIIFAAVETALVNYVVKYKFCITHQIMHEIKPLYAMTHIEHHICKGVHPTTPAAGLWEFWVCGQSIFFTTQLGLAPIPYAILQFIYMGANIVVHTMWPHPSLLQYHTLHHTIAADVYNVNIPSAYDKKHSRTVAKLQNQLQEISPFVRYEPLSDIAAFGFIVLSCTLMHYGLGIGIGHVDWAGRVDWQ